MEQLSESELVKKHFHYLFNEYGFVITEAMRFEHFSNWAIVLVSPKCRIKLVEDRGTVSLSCGPLWDPPGWESGPWYDLAFVVAYLNQEPVKLLRHESLPVELQMEQLAATLRLYIDRVCEIFDRDAFPAHQDKLSFLWKMWYEDFLNRSRHL